MFIVLILEIPGYLFHYLTIQRLFHIKKSYLAHAALLFISSLITCMIIFIGDWYNLPPTFFLYLVTIQFSCMDSPAKKLSLALMLSSAVFAWNIFLDDILGLYHSPPKMALYRVCFSAFLYLLIRFRGPDRETELGNSLWHLMSFLTLAPMGIVLSIVLIADEGWQPFRSRFLYTILLLLTILTFIGLLWTIAVLSRQKKLEQQSLYAEMNQAYYDSMRQQHFEIRRLKHDLSNHLRALSLLPESEKEDYIANLLKSPGLTQRTDYCGDMTVNAVLTVKDTVMRENNISLTLKLDITEDLPFEKADVCALFANALDNAIESCLTLPKEKRFIELTARCQKGIFAMLLKNPTTLTLDARVPASQQAPSCVPAYKKGKPLKDSPKKFAKSFLPSTKPDPGLHGYGLRSMESIVRHYQGNLEVSADGSVFELFLYLPEPQNPTKIETY